MRQTKADLEMRIRELEEAFDSLLASHKDCTSGHGFTIEWAKRVEQEAEKVRYRIK
jgi:hypothetical protein